MCCKEFTWSPGQAVWPPSSTFWPRISSAWTSSSAADCRWAKWEKSKGMLESLTVCLLSLLYFWKNTATTESYMPVQSHMCFTAEQFLHHPNSGSLTPNPQHWVLQKIKNSPELFTAQDFDVTTALLYLSRGWRVRFQVFVIKGDLKKEPNLVHNLICGRRPEMARRSHLTGFAQEVYGVVSFQEGRHWETVEEHQITICVSLRLEERSSCSVMVTRVILGVKSLTQSIH